MSLIYCEPYDRCARSTGHRFRLSDSYDYQTRLVWRRMDGNGDGDYEQKRVFVYDGNQMVMDFQRTGAGNIQASNLKWRYLWGPAVDQILAEEAVNGGADETVQWTLTDHLNTVRDIAKYDSQTDTTTVVNHLVYDAFGRVTSETDPAVDSLFLFTARPFDQDTQLQNNLNRWYDASVGRWLSEDPVGFASSEKNLYRYAHNDPVQGFDPMGLSIISPIPILGTVECWLTAFKGTRIGDYDSIVSEGKTPSREECCSPIPEVRQKAIADCKRAVTELARSYLMSVALTYGFHVFPDVLTVVGHKYIRAVVGGPAGVVISIIGTLDAFASAWCVSNAADEIGATAAWVQRNFCVCR